jgi:hypothetical protein
MQNIELFFKDVEKAAKDFGKTPFPEIVTLTEYLSRSNLPKEDVSYALSTGLRKVAPYFLWFNDDAFILSDFAKYEEAYTISYESEIASIETKRNEYYSKLEKYSNLEEDKIDAYVEQFLRICRLDDGLNEKLDKVKKTRNVLPTGCKEKYISDTSSYITQLLNSADELIDSYTDYWLDLLSLVEGYYSYIKEKSSTVKFYIPISEEWTKEKLAILYDSMAERGWIETGKKETFISIFTGFYGSENAVSSLPIKWLFPVSTKNSHKVSSNVVALHYLVAALKDRSLFETIVEGVATDMDGKEKPYYRIVEDTLHNSDKIRLCEYFVYANGNPIKLKDLSYRGKTKLKSSILSEARNSKDKGILEKKIGFPIDKKMIDYLNDNLGRPRDAVKWARKHMRIFNESAYEQIIDLLDSIK